MASYALNDLAMDPPPAQLVAGSAPYQDLASALAPSRVAAGSAPYQDLASAGGSRGGARDNFRNWR